MDIKLVLLVAVSLGVLVFTTRHVYQESKNVGRAFLTGFAYPAFFVSLFTIYYTVDGGALPRGMSREIFAVLAASIVYLSLKEGFCYFWKVRNALKKRYQNFCNMFRKWGW